MSGKGYAAIPTAVLYDTELSTEAKMVYLVLSSHVGAEETQWPSHATIGKVAGVSVATVKRRLKELRGRGLIEWETRIGYGKMKQTNAYRIVAGSAPSPVKSDSSHRPQCHADPSVTVSDPELRIVQADTSVPVSERTKELKPRTKKPSGPAEAGPIRADVEGLCSALADGIAANDPQGNRPVVTADWRTQARLLLDTDKRPLDQAHMAIKWCQAHPFWRSNILSMGKFRKQYTAMHLQAKAEASPQLRGETFQHRREVEVQAAIRARRNPLAAAL